MCYNGHSSLILFSGMDTAVNAPSIQKANFAQEYSLRCSTILDGMHVELKRSSNSTTISRRLRKISTADEGFYQCTIIDTMENTIIFNRTIRLVVLCKEVFCFFFTLSLLIWKASQYSIVFFFFPVPPNILQVPFVKDLYGVNEPANFTVQFRSRKLNTSVTWLHDGFPPKNAVIVTRYPSKDGDSPATTSLLFSRLTKADEGNYTLIISNNYTLLPPEDSTATTTFSVVFYSMYM